MAACVLLILTACDPMAPRATPQIIVVTSTPTVLPTRSITSTPTPTRTPIPTETPDWTPTPTPFPCEEDGQLIVFELDSPSSREQLPYHVYIPPCYQQSLKRFPYLILIHGATFRQTQWEDLGIVEALDRGIRLGVLPPMVVVMPYYGNIGTRNAFPPQTSYETVIMEELVPQIETDFCTWNDRSYRAIGGISRGGFWAFSLGMRYPDIFGIIGSHSGFFPDDEGEVPPAYNPVELARNSTLLPEAGLRIYLDNSARDDAGIRQKTLSDRLTARAIPHAYVINTVGEHDNEYWSAHLSEYLDFYGQTWPKNYDELPTCLEPSP